MFFLHDCTEKEFGKLNEKQYYSSHYAASNPLVKTGLIFFQSFTYYDPRPKVVAHITEWDGFNPFSAL